MNSQSDQKYISNDRSVTRGIRGRLFIGFGAIILIMLLAIIVILYKVTITENASSQVVEVELPTHNAFYDLTIQIYESQRSLVNMVITKNVNIKTRFDASWKLTDKKIQTIDSYAKSWNDQVYLTKWHEVKVLLSKLKEGQDKIISSPENSSNILATEVIPTFNAILDVIDGPLTVEGDRQGGMFDSQYNALKIGADNIVLNMDVIRNILYTLFVLTFIAAFIAAFYTARGIVFYVNNFRKHSAMIASGDLRHRINVESHDELGQLGNDLNTMTNSLAGITKQIIEACHNMVTTIEEVRHAVDVQSSGATEQASSINQITASLEEIEKSSSQTIDKAKTLGEMAERTQEKGHLGLEAVENSILGMKAVRDKVQIIAQTILDLSNQTQQVGEITSVVNTLAQQSKMLALNASIEAAKAGEAGKGFAVVASEVKNLAEQSEQSTTQVQKILEDIRRATEKAVMATEEGTKGVDQGTSLVEQTGDIVRSLSDVIHETTIASQQIEAAIRQEGVGIEQITSGMNEINQVTASFVDSVKQTTEAISNLAEMVKNLKQFTDIYKL